MPETIVDVDRNHFTNVYNFLFKLINFRLSQQINDNFASLCFFFSMSSKFDKFNNVSLLELVAWLYSKDFDKCGQDPKCTGNWNTNNVVSLYIVQSAIYADVGRARWNNDRPIHTEIWNR